MEYPHLRQLLQVTDAPGPAIDSLILLLEATIELLSTPGNDFCWSYWNDEHEATGELRGLVHALKSRNLPNWLHVAVLFAPTGPLQEVAMSSGWAQTYMKVADKFDEVEALLYSVGKRKGSSKYEPS